MARVPEPRVIRVGKRLIPGLEDPHDLELAADLALERLDGLTLALTTTRFGVGAERQWLRGFLRCARR